jgi:hypothetical protein
LSLSLATQQAIRWAAEQAVDAQNCAELRRIAPAFAHEKLDALERIALANPAALLFPEYVHRFVTGLYQREIILPGGVPGGYVHTTKIHQSEHAFVVLTGEAEVYSPEGLTLIRAPHVGVTYPGTRRVIRNFVECRWMTLHVLSLEEEAMRQAGAPAEELIAAIERRIIEWRELDNGMSAFEMFTANPEIRAAAQAAGLPVANLRAALPEGGF